MCFIIILKCLIVFQHVESSGGQCVGCRFRGEESLAHYSPWSCGTIGPCLSPFEPETLTHTSAHSCTEHSVRLFPHPQGSYSPHCHCLFQCVLSFLRRPHLPPAGVRQQWRGRRRRRWQQRREAVAAFAGSLPPPEGRGPDHSLQRGAHYLQVGRHIQGVTHRLPHHRPCPSHSLPEQCQHHAHQL